MESRTVKTFLLIVVVAVIATVQIQICAFFYRSVDDAEEIENGPCYRNVNVSFAHNVTSKDLLKKWKSSSSDAEGRLFAVARSAKNYMAIGVVFSDSVDISVPLDSLGQLVNYTSLYDKLHTVVLAIIPSNVADNKVQEISGRILSDFAYEVIVGFIYILQQPPLSLGSGESGPTVDVLAMVLSSRYISTVANHYLHIGDTSVDIAADYVDNIRDFVHRETHRRQRGPLWTVLEFAAPGNDFLGYFLHAVDVQRFSTLFVMFEGAAGGRNRTTSIAQVFLEIVTQRTPTLRRPPLFRRRDRTDEITENFAEKPWPSADDPPGSVLSSMTPVDRHTADLVYGSGAGFFRTSSAAAGDWLAVVFEVEINIQRILVQTGLPDGSLTLKSGIVELSPRLLKLDASTPNVVCADFVRIGEIVGKSAAMENVRKLVWGRPTRCLRVTVTAVDDYNGGVVVFRQIAVYTEHS